MYRHTHGVDVVLAGEQMWPWVFQMIGKLPTLKEAPEPAEPAAGITDRKPDNTLALLPQTPDSQVPRTGQLIMCLKRVDRNIMG